MIVSENDSVNTFYENLQIIEKKDVKLNILKITNIKVWLKSCPW